jgi:hypothetical protein
MTLKSTFYLQIYLFDGGTSFIDLDMSYILFQNDSHVCPSYPPPSYFITLPVLRQE